MICIPIVARTTDAIAEEMWAAARIADLVELRLDYAPSADLERLLRNRPCPVIVTCRPVRQGGCFEGPEGERLGLLQRAVDLAAEYVDVELDCVQRLRRGGRTRVIVSHHDFERTPPDLDGLHDSIVRSGADVAKIACMICDICDNLRLFRVLRRTHHPTILLGMGELGLVSRILGRKFGNYLVYASLAPGKESAPGQVPAAELRDMYGYHRIGPGTAIYGLIGDPIAHSMSPAVMNAAFRHAGVDAVYVPFRVQRDVVGFVKAYREMDVSGYSVTIPHKETVLPAMDDVDEVVKRVGALNTVMYRGGRLVGTNTDVPAALAALENALGGDAGPGPRALDGRSVLIIGAGGAARAVAFGLAERGAMIVIANRTPERGRRLAEQIGARFCPLDRIADVRADIIVNTTSVGMHPAVNETPVPRVCLRPGAVVFDAVYNPMETRLLREARESGCKIVTGVEWFIRQAALQFELWTGLPAPREAMERALRARLGNP